MVFKISTRYVYFNKSESFNTKGYLANGDISKQISIFSNTWIQKLSNDHVFCLSINWLPPGIFIFFFMIYSFCDSRNDYSQTFHTSNIFLPYTTSTEETYTFLSFCIILVWVGSLCISLGNYHLFYYLTFDVLMPYIPN